MDQLELLKKQWQSQEQELPQFSYKDIYKLLLKKSSSLVKWILIISIAELFFWASFIFLLPESYGDFTKEMGIGNLELFSNVLQLVVFGVFIFLFYKNYRAIKVTDTTKELMKNILKTRKTLKFFVYYNIGIFILSSIIINIIYYTKSDKLYESFKIADKGIPKEDFFLHFIVVEALILGIFLGLLILFYYLVYGSLLRRLKKNYRELKKIEL